MTGSPTTEPQPEVTLDDLGPYDPVEQAARALHEHDRLERDPPIPGLGPEPPWEELAEVHRESYRKVVRPALEAALSALPATMTRPVDFATAQRFAEQARANLAAAEKDRDACERALAEIALACAVPIAGVRDILSPDQIRDLVGEALAAAEARGRQKAVAEAVADHLESTGGQP